MSKRRIVTWIALCAVAPVAGVGAAVALGAPPPPPPTSSSSPPPTSTTTPPATSSSPPATTTHPPPSSSTHPKTTHHQTKHPSSTPTTATTTQIVTPAAAPAVPVAHGSTIPHIALVTSIIVGGATVFAALVLAAALAVMRGRSGGPKGPEGGHIFIR
jgi:hypothetical protein